MDEGLLFLWVVGGLALAGALIREGLQLRYKPRHLKAKAPKNQTMPMRPLRTANIDPPTSFAPEKPPVALRLEPESRRLWP